MEPTTAPPFKCAPDHSDPLQGTCRSRSEPECVRFSCSWLVSPSASQAKSTAAIASFKTLAHSLAIVYQGELGLGRGRRNKEICHHH